MTQRFDGLADRSVVQFKPAQPITAYRIRAAAPRNVARDGSQLSHQVTQVRILFEVVAAAVRHDAAVENVDLAYRPRVKTLLREQLLEACTVANLDVAST